MDAGNYLQEITSITMLVLSLCLALQSKMSKTEVDLKENLFDSFEDYMTLDFFLVSCLQPGSFRMWTEVFLLLVLLWILYNGAIAMVRPSNFPPGPLGLPFIGSFHYITGDLGKNALSLSKTYGNAFSLTLKNENAVFVVGYELIKEVMDNTRKFCGRPPTLAIQLSRGDNYEGIGASPYGPQLVAHRKFFYTVLRKMGLSKHNFDKVIKEELPYFVSELQALAKSGKKVDPTSALEYAILNVLAYFVFGSRYSYGDVKFKQLLACNDVFFHHMGRVNSPTFALVSIVPYLHKLWLPRSAREIKNACRKIEEFLTSEIEYHRSTLDPNNPRDFIDYYLQEIHQSNLFTESYLKKTILDFFQAGTETTQTTLKWALIYMANNPGVQKKVQTEIDKVLENGKLPTYEDRLKMPYVEATILESLRKATILPFGVVRATTEEVNLGKYVLPKSTLVFPVFESMHYSPEQWKNPDKFDPENFLDADGTVGSRPAFMPFGGGLRICLGMNIGKQVLFLLFVAMMQNFTFEPPAGLQKISEEYIPGLTLQPKTFEFVMKPRF